MALETGGRATIHYKPSGVVCDIILPKSSLVELSERPAAKLQLASPSNIKSPIPANPRLLVVEDSFLVLLSVEGMCEELGWEVVGPATRLDEALRLARTEVLDAALLDVNLDGDMSWEVADILAARGIPFTFSTGYDHATILPAHLINAEVITKPYRIEDLERRVRQMMTLRVM